MRSRTLCLVAVLCGTVLGACAKDSPTAVRANGTATTGTGEISFQGVIFSIPPGWKQARPACGRPADRTVVVGLWGGSCSGAAQDKTPTSSVQLAAIYGRQFASGWDGSQTEWKSQSAWQSEVSDSGFTTLRLALPRLNVFIAATAATSDEAHRLLDRARPDTAPDLDVPARAASIYIESLAGTDGDGLSRNTTVTEPAEVRHLLDDLRESAPVDPKVSACDGSWWQNTALLTVHIENREDRTFAARFDACGQVVSGTGAAGIVSDQLRADVVRLVPNSGLTP